MFVNSSIAFLCIWKHTVTCMPHSLLIYVAYLLTGLIDAYLWILVVRAILSWIPILVSARLRVPAFVHAILRAMIFLTDKPIAWLNRYIPSMQLGNIRFDVSFLVYYVAILVLRIVITKLIFVLL